MRRGLLVVLMAVMSGVPVAAQDEEPSAAIVDQDVGDVEAPGSQNPPPLPPAPPPWEVLRETWELQLPDLPVLRQSAVTRDDTVQRVTLQETIAIALENNPRIAARRLDPVLQEAGVLQAQSKFDPLFDGDATWAQADTPTANALASNTGAISTRNRDVNMGLQKLFRSGTLLDVDFLTDRDDSNQNFLLLNPQYSPELGLSLVQPLLRDFGWDFSYLVVKAAAETAEAAVFQYEADLQDFVLEVIGAYWSVVGSREQLAVQREARDLAETTVRENEARVRVGLLAPVAVLEAQADRAARETDVIVAENRVLTDRMRLAQLAFFRPDGTFVPRMLEPIDEIRMEELDVDEDETLEVALEERPDIHASKGGVRARQYDERIAQNQLLPRLDFVGGYTFFGLSGRSRPQPDRFTGEDTKSPLRGTESEAYRRLANADFTGYNVGVRVEVPLSNAARRADQAQRRIALDQAQLSHRQLLSEVTLEVRETVADLRSTQKAVDNTRVAKYLASENLRNQTKRHEVGMATTKDLLDFQQRLTLASSQEVQARIQYAIAVARWERSQGTLLDRHHVAIDHPSRKRPPWFALF
jgi:outer membrane protein TolC